MDEINMIFNNEINDNNITLNNDDTENKFIGILLCGACGDILGSQNEGKKNINYVTLLPVGKKYTDDTEMMLILTKHLIKNNNINIPQLHEEYLYELKKYNRGYSSKTKNQLEYTEQSNYLNTPNQSDTNGSIMRIAALSLIKFKNDEILYEYIKKAIYFTHNSNDAHFSCYIFIKLLKEIVFNNNQLTKDYLINYLLKLSENNTSFYIRFKLISLFLIENEFNWNITKDLLGQNIFQIKAIDCLSISIYIFLYLINDPLSAICTAASIGGDTDTIAKIVGDLCGALYGYKWLPIEWGNIENEEEIIELGRKLYSNYKLNNTL